MMLMYFIYSSVKISCIPQLNFELSIKLKHSRKQKNSTLGSVAQCLYSIFVWTSSVDCKTAFLKSFLVQLLVSQCIDADVVHIIFLHTCIVTNIFLCEYHCIALKNQIWITCINKGKSSTDALVIMTLEKRVLKISEIFFSARRNNHKDRTQMILWAGRVCPKTFSLEV